MSEHKLLYEATVDDLLAELDRRSDDATVTTSYLLSWRAGREANVVTNDVDLSGYLINEAVEWYNDEVADDEDDDYGIILDPDFDLEDDDDE